MENEVALQIYLSRWLNRVKSLLPRTSDPQILSKYLIYTCANGSQLD